MKSGKGSFIAQAVVCIVVIAWQIYDLAIAPEKPSLYMSIFDIVVMLCGIAGLAGAVYALRKPAAA